MVARNRLWRQFKEHLTLVGVLLIVTVGLPLIAQIAGTSPQSIPQVALLERAGWYVLRLAPGLLLLLLLLNFVGIRRKQAKINRQIAEEGITYLILPRPEMRQREQVTLWQRIAEVLPYYKHISFEVSGGEDGIAFSLCAPSDAISRTMLIKIMAEWPGTEVRRLSGADDPLAIREGEVAYWAEVKPQRKGQPIVPATSQPLLALLAELALLPKGMRAGFQVGVREDPYSRLDMSRQAALLTSKKPDKGPYALRPSAEDIREVRNLDQRAQNSFLEARILVWAAFDTGSEAKQTAISLAEGLAAQYHPLNSLKTGKQKKGSRASRDFPTFAGHPWTAKELGQLAHLVGESQAAPQLLMAPARPLPALPASRLPLDAKVSELVSMSQPAIKIESKSDLTSLIIEEESDLASLIIEEESDWPELVFEEKWESYHDKSNTK